MSVKIEERSLHVDQAITQAIKRLWPHLKLPIKGMGVVELTFVHVVDHREGDHLVRMPIRGRGSSGEKES